jgi:hypothetical protein
MKPMRLRTQHRGLRRFTEKAFDCCDGFRLLAEDGAGVWHLRGVHLRQYDPT